MSQTKVNQLLQTIETAILDIKKELAMDVTAKSVVKRSRRAKARKEGSTGPVTNLLDGGFFAEPKTVSHLQSELRARRGLIFDENDLAVTMLRLVRKGRIARQGTGTRTDRWKYMAQ